MLILIWRIDAYWDALSFPLAMRDAQALLHEKPAVNTLKLEPFDAKKALYRCTQEAGGYEDPARNPLVSQGLIDSCTQRQREGYRDLQHVLDRIGGYTWGKVLLEAQLSSDQRWGYVDYYWVEFWLGMDEATFHDILDEVAKGELTPEHVQHGLDREAQNLRASPQKRHLFLSDTYYFAHHPTE